MIAIFSILIIVLAFIGVIAGTTFTLCLMFSPKVRAKMMKKQVQAVRYFAEDSKEDLAGIAAASADVMDASKDSLKKMADVGAEINKDALETTAEAISSGVKKGINK